MRELSWLVKLDPMVAFLSGGMITDDQQVQSFLFPDQQSE